MEAVANKMRRLLGPTRNAVRRDALAVTDVKETAEDAADGDDSEAWVAFLKAKESLTDKERDRRKRGKPEKAKGGAGA